MTNRFAWLGLVVGLPVVALAQNADPQVLVVPFAPQNTNVPYPAHEGAHVTLKGMLRNANCAQGYDVRWDANRNGVFDDDANRHVTPSGGTVYDIGRTYVVPEVDNDSSTPVDVRVTNRCNGRSSFATYPMFTYDWQPSPDPRNWDDDQLEMSARRGTRTGSASRWPTTTGSR